MSRLIDFYRGDGRDVEGRRLEDAWEWDDGAWEEAHDFVQWLFPLPERSRFNPDAPLLAPPTPRPSEATNGYASDCGGRTTAFLLFVGLAEEDGRVVDGPNLAARTSDVWAVPNHNWLRISRVLRSMALLGLKTEAQALYAWLSDAYNRHRFPIGADTFRYWTEAVASEPIS